jgi:hypothetical protein
MRWTLSRDFKIKWDHGPSAYSYLARRRITVTLSIFKFCPRFLAQIVENRETQL